MKVNLFETHDRYKHFINDQSKVICEGADDCLKKNPLSLAIQARSPYVYLFAHPRTADDGVTKRMLWQPRLSKPYPQTNSYLFRAKSHTDLMEICWLLPPREMWANYERKNIAESEFVLWSINQFKYHRDQLGKPFPDDFPEDKIREILRVIAQEMEQEKKMKKMYQNPSQAFEKI